jgi:large subunit ribosomal protein L35
MADERRLSTGCLLFPAFLLYMRPFRTARPVMGCRGGSFRSRETRRQGPADPGAPETTGPPARESKMPKLKTKSGAKKRFKITGTGKVVYAHQGKRHGMIKRTNKAIRNLRGTAVLFKTDGDNIKKYFLPNG